jgi:hypothetical protein
MSDARTIFEPTGASAKRNPPARLIRATADLLPVAAAVSGGAVSGEYRRFCRSGSRARGPLGDDLDCRHRSADQSDGGGGGRAAGYRTPLQGGRGKARQHRFGAVFDRFDPFIGSHRAARILSGQSLTITQDSQTRLKTVKTVKRRPLRRCRMNWRQLAQLRGPLAVALGELAPFALVRYPGALCAFDRINHNPLSTVGDDAAEDAPGMKNEKNAPKPLRQRHPRLLTDVRIAEKFSTTSYRPPVSCQEGQRGRRERGHGKDSMEFDVMTRATTWDSVATLARRSSKRFSGMLFAEGHPVPWMNIAPRRAPRGRCISRPASRSPLGGARWLGADRL